jgi:hypothetical protein
MLPFTLEPNDEVEFSAGSIRSAATRLHGIARLAGDRLVLQWSGEAEITTVRGPEVSHRVQSLPVHEVAVPVGALGGVRRRGWLRPRLELWSTDLTMLREVPGARRGRLRLRIARGDRALADELIASLELAMADAALSASDARELPPSTP